jgi:YD repeat-containing protein
MVNQYNSTAYEYYNNGLLKERIGPKEDTKIDYDPRWKKVSRVNQNGLVSNYMYDDRGNLVEASNTKKEKVTLKYDRLGRISEMLTPGSKPIVFRYGERGKPTVVSQTGVGTIKIDYTPQGSIRSVETLNESKNRKPSKDDSREIARRVMQSFQQLLNVIRPAGVGLNIG